MRFEKTPLASWRLGGTAGPLSSRIAPGGVALQFVEAEMACDCGLTYLGRSWLCSRTCPSKTFLSFSRRSVRHHVSLPETRGEA